MDFKADIVGEFLPNILKFSISGSSSKFSFKALVREEVETRVFSME
jgi:hypothetical protein